jgi:hypothetical protein
MNKLDNSQQLQEVKIPISNLQASILIAFERTMTEPYNIENMVKDIISEFPKVNPDDILKAIRNGSLGKYGKTYKLSTQEVCIWIREFLKEKNKINIAL